MGMFRNLLILLALFLVSCAEETLFKEVVDEPILNEEEIIMPEDPEGHNELNVCEANSTSPLCLTFCELTPDDTSCNSGSEPISNCETNPELDSCKDLCEMFPAHQSCADESYCVVYPNSIECKAYCLAFPSDPDCSNIVDCNDTPDDPSCKLFCDMYPFSSICNNEEDNGGEDHITVTTTEEYYQSEDNNKVDIVWVIDNSGSMSDEQSALGYNFRSFIDSFVENKSNYQMGITSTDTTGRGSIYEHDGEFLGSVPVLTSDMDQSDVRNNFIRNVKVGVGGSGSERGLEAASMAINKSSYSASQNYGFVRDDAFLAVIIVSDENDISPNSTNSYIESIRAAKANPSQVAIYSIVDTRSKSYEDPFTSVVDLDRYYSNWINPGGLRYINASDSTGGFVEDIHEDFAQSLLNIGSDIVELIKSFQLNNTPLIYSITVKIDGEFIQKNNINGWTYDDSTRSIKFNGDSVPVHGAKVDIDYKYYQ